MEAKSNRKLTEVASEAAEKETDKPLSPYTVLEVSAKSGDKRRTYNGKFPFRVPTLGDRVDIASKKAQYLNQVPTDAVDAEGTSVAGMLAYLHVTINGDGDKDKAKMMPAWWRDSNDGIDLYDFSPIIELYAKARAYEATFLVGDDDTPSDESEDRKRSESDDSGDVEPDVQSPSERPETLATFGKGGVRPSPPLTNS